MKLVLLMNKRMLRRERSMSKKAAAKKKCGGLYAVKVKPRAFH